MNFKKIIIAWFIAVALVFVTLAANAQDWKPNPDIKAKNEAKSKKQQDSKAVQCWGTTKKSERCKMKGKPNHGDKYYCHWHESQA